MGTILKINVIFSTKYLIFMKYLNLVIYNSVAEVLNLRHVTRCMVYRETTYSDNF